MTHDRRRALAGAGGAALGAKGQRARCARLACFALPGRAAGASESPDEVWVYDVGDDAGAATPGHFGLWPWPQPGGWLGVGLGEGDGDDDGRGGAVVVVGFELGFAALVAVAGLPGLGAVVTLLPRPDDRTVRDRGLLASGGAVGEPVAEGGAGRVTRGALDGLLLTSTLRLSRSVRWNVVLTTFSPTAWKPMTTSSPVAMVASSTMTTLGSTGPRVLRLRVTCATSPRLVPDRSGSSIGRCDERL